MADNEFPALIPADYIGAVRDGLRAVAPRTPDAALCREAADFVQTILDAKHACPSARFGGYGGDLGARFDDEFATRCPNKCVARAKSARRKSIAYGVKKSACRKSRFRNFTILLPYSEVLGDAQEKAMVSRRNDRHKYEDHPLHAACSGPAVRLRCP